MVHELSKGRKQIEGRSGVQNGRARCEAVDSCVQLHGVARISRITVEL